MLSLTYVSRSWDYPHYLIQDSFLINIVKKVNLTYVFLHPDNSNLRRMSHDLGIILTI